MPLPVGVTRHVATEYQACDVSGKAINPGDVYFLWQGYHIAKPVALIILAIAKLLVSDLV